MLPPEPAVFKALHDAAEHDYTTSSMQTVRIPLTDFDGVEAASIRYVRLHFGDAARRSSSGEIVLDDLGFDFD